MEQIKGGINGQKVMNCIMDAYSNHGWLSVYIWVQSIYLPQTSVAIGLACAGHIENQ